MKPLYIILNRQTGEVYTNGSSGYRLYKSIKATKEYAYPAWPHMWACVEIQFGASPNPCTTTPDESRITEEEFYDSVKDALEETQGLLDDCVEEMKSTRYNLTEDINEALETITTLKGLKYEDQLYK